MKLIYLPAIFACIIQNGNTQALKKSEAVILNGHYVYYEIYGKGEPLLLLHGYTLSTKSWEPFVEEYSKNYEVYLVDLQGHGKSGAFKENLSIKSVAKDVDALIKYLNLKNIHAVGYSYGGDVLFQLALMHPGIIKSMISIGACGIWQAKQFPELIEFFSFNNIRNLSWMYDHQPNENQIRLILEQFPNYDIVMSDEEIRSIGTNTLIVLGDKDDSVPLENVLRVKKNIPHSYLWILPNTGHGAHNENKEEFVKKSYAFFQGQWADK
ncbi:MAG: alpha/beta hydrolase [Cyclobacteriaceae bacterium]